MMGIPAKNWLVMFALSAMLWLLIAVVIEAVL
jgi:hypothetical protein